MHSKHIATNMKMNGDKEIVSEKLVSRIEARFPKDKGTENRTAKEIPAVRLRTITSVNKIFNNLTLIRPTRLRVDRMNATFKHANIKLM